jgi:hypothetical protein
MTQDQSIVEIARRLVDYYRAERIYCLAPPLAAKAVRTATSTFAPPT